MATPGVNKLKTGTFNTAEYVQFAMDNNVNLDTIEANIAAFGNKTGVTDNYLNHGKSQLQINNAGPQVKSPTEPGAFDWLNNSFDFLDGDGVFGMESMFGKDGSMGWLNSGAGITLGALDYMGGKKANKIAERGLNHQISKDGLDAYNQGTLLNDQLKEQRRWQNEQRAGAGYAGTLDPYEKMRTEI